MKIMGVNSGLLPSAAAHAIPGEFQLLPAYLPVASCELAEGQPDSLF